MKDAKARLPEALLLLILFATVFCLFQPCRAANYSQTYQLLNEPNGTTHYGLNVTSQQSLYEYYLGKNHNLGTLNDFAKFVTPYSVKPIADRLWQVYSDDEDFVNGALMIAHQINYEENTPAKYPVETIVTNKGDCDVFSYYTASILKAGGLDVILIYYADTPAHMNIGVSLSHAPNHSRAQAYSVPYNNIQYYMAECTGGNWQTGWRVGECPDGLQTTSKQIITLENCELTAPGQVSASYSTLQSSAISLVISSTLLIQGSTATIGGHLTPALNNQTITIYLKENNSPWIVIANATTDPNGQFRYAWIAETGGIIVIRASWSGNADYAGTDSQAQTLIVLSPFLVILIVLMVILACVAIIVYLLSRRENLPFPEPQPPPIPT